mmetsp:Transcript_2189/g.3377  ORF Transcript_2189/g.3377 Transcript_2189/m.3377 type:complete len:181 (+) Transcript_2189:64-606(+)|eukprot:CAMPEP_0185024638 /NCGR_PEP_ID=MMETSP1103-20130426/7800_1 /TAXON_ID=36769 /ORGANISM="Paraphysomonas bandaiensis, Strain Caron Lab Isolate" /LENGTH=180 /DNA_ID=CAMNT_0027557659 /DNA_START=53 /DNA_END=595 /DNA_ORIENTATION=+
MPPKRSNHDHVKPKKDKNAPKHARTAYMFFMEENRNDFRAANPDASFGTLSRLIADKWKIMTPEEKAPYEAQALQDKQRYKDEMVGYVRPPELDNIKRKRAKKDPNAPKGALSSYIIFSNVARNEIKAENPETPVTEVMRIIGERWRAMSAEDKLPFEEMSARDKMRYESEMSAFRSISS